MLKRASLTMDLLFGVLLIFNIFTQLFFSANSCCVWRTHLQQLFLGLIYTEVNTVAGKPPND